jgi:hypothetical protein
MLADAHLQPWRTVEEVMMLLVLKAYRSCDLSAQEKQVGRECDFHAADTEP